MKPVLMENYKRKISDKLSVFLFNELNLYYLAIFRIALSLIILIVFFYVNNSQRILYTDFYNYYDFYDSYIISTPYLILSAILVVLFGIGFKSRLFGFIFVILLFPLVLQYGVHISRQILLITIFFFFY